MTRIVRQLAAILIVAGGAVRLPAIAEACSCAVSRPPCEAAWTANAVFAGRVVEITRNDDPRPTDPLKMLEWSHRRLSVRLAVAEKFLGIDAADAIVATSDSTASCGYPFAVGREYLVYGYEREGRLVVSLCSRTRLLTEAAEDLAYLRAIPKETPTLGRLVGRARLADMDFVNGRMTDDQAPVPGVRLLVEGEGRRLNAVTKSDGTFELPAPPGHYVMTAEAPAGLSASSPIKFDLKDARGCASQNIYIRTDGRVSGQVVSWNGAPVPHLPVALMAPNHPDYRSLPARTDAEGRYEVKLVPPGKFLLSVDPFQERSFRPWHPPSILFPGTLEPVNAHVIEMTASARIVLPPFVLPSTPSFSVVSGKVVAADGVPIAGARVHLYLDGKSYPSIGEPVETDQAGAFALALKNGESYRVSVELYRPGAISLEGETRVKAPATTPITIVLRPIR